MSSSPLPDRNPAPPDVERPGSLADPDTISGRLHPRAMSIKHMMRKVRQAEDALEAHERQVAANVRQMRRSWKAAWTAPRIVLAGLAGGFLVGLSQPGRAVGKLGGLPQILNLVSVAAGLFAGGQAQQAADEAEHVARAADGYGFDGPPFDGAAADPLHEGTDAGAYGAVPPSAIDPKERRVAESVGT